MISQILDWAKDKAVVVLTIPGVVVMPWEHKAKNILACFFLGQEMGNSIADVLFGVTNPSAKRYAC